MGLLYILMFLSLWAMGIVFLVYSFKTNFWIGMTLIIGGMSSFTFSIHLVIVPFLQTYGWLSPIMSGALFELSAAAMNMYFYFFPFAACMGGLWIGALPSDKKRLLLSLLLAVPAAVLFTLHLLREPWSAFDVGTFRWWSGLYFVSGYAFYHIAFAREKDGYERRNKKRVAILFSFGTLWAFVSDYIGFVSLTMEEWRFDLVSNGTWKLNAVIILGLIAVIIYYTIKHGFLGIKLRIERERLDYSMRALTMGVSILNHSIKNEIQKINYLTEKTQGFIHAGQTDKSLHTIDQIHSVTAHLLDMVGRIKEKADDIVLSEGSVRVKELFAAVLLPMQPLLERRSVEVVQIQDEGGELTCDLLHLKETLSNLVHNAVDAMEEQGGTITLRAMKSKRHFIIEVKDTGCGIPKEQLGKIFEPFYTTKKNSSNHGLGLSYCMSVMRKHGGSLEIADTETGKGTSVMLHFPIRRYKQPAATAPAVASQTASVQQQPT
ncbi:HAMP domain-containing histidine kinase [Paenibacillus sp. N4]|uniref:sensor histidine kinase n=1 Tax=Paenibacillus vietnamensis TaxID=2590547 RepID=UPI001CD05686|nr:HAMP domain-containing sensor histidine kinase [Paenibacillus vietnamensis]MCA0757342.1 HAMP domain-containing histidine kinase [Paenibacillus vietnamensis]